MFLFTGTALFPKLLTANLHQDVIRKFRYQVIFKMHTRFSILIDEKMFAWNYIACVCMQYFPSFLSNRFCKVIYRRFFIKVSLQNVRCSFLYSVSMFLPRHVPRIALCENENWRLPLLALFCSQTLVLWKYWMDFYNQ